MSCEIRIIPLLDLGLLFFQIIFHAEEQEQKDRTYHVCDRLEPDIADRVFHSIWSMTSASMARIM